MFDIIFGAFGSFHAALSVLQQTQYDTEGILYPSLQVSSLTSAPADRLAKGLKKLASLRHDERDFHLLQEHVSDLQCFVEGVREVILEFETTTTTTSDRPSYQGFERALERTQSTRMELENLIVYDLTSAADSSAETGIDRLAWSTNQAAVQASR